PPYARRHTYATCTHTTSARGLLDVKNHPSDCKGKYRKCQGFFPNYKNPLTQSQKLGYSSKHEIYFRAELLLFPSANFRLARWRAEVIQFLAAKASWMS